MQTTTAIRDVESSVQAGADGHSPEGFERIVGSSSRLLEAVQRARLLARANTPLLLQGETGAGKELLAHAVHESGPQRSGPFVSVHCAGLTPELLASELFGHDEGGAPDGTPRARRVGKLEAAHGGTLFLDEIGELPPELQASLLRVLESGELYPAGSTRPRSVEFRLISTSSRDLCAAVEADRFRADLYYRISVASLTIPSLRERRDDLPALIAHLAEEVAALHAMSAKRFAPPVLEALSRYSWPGNVRELRNVIESMTLLSEHDTIDESALPSALTSEADRFGDAGLSSALEAPGSVGLEGVEQEAIRRCLRANGGNLTRTARELCIARSTLYAKVKKFGLDGPIEEWRLARGGQQPSAPVLSLASE